LLCWVKRELSRVTFVEYQPLVVQKLPIGQNMDATVESGGLMSFELQSGISTSQELRVHLFLSSADTGWQLEAANNSYILNLGRHAGLRL
jgi:hypothetical protein